jgi:hypothetical protein
MCISAAGINCHHRDIYIFLYTVVRVLACNLKVALVGTNDRWELRGGVGRVESRGRYRYSRLDGRSLMTPNTLLSKN